MSQWGQPGFQYPMQTGFPAPQPQQQFQPPQQLNPNPQFQQPQGGFGGVGVPSLGAGFGGLAPQPTGFPGARPQGFQQPQQTGFPGPQGVNTGFLQAQPTGFLGASSGFQQRPPPPPVPPLPSQYQQTAPPPPPPPQQSSNFLNANQNRLGGPSTGSFGTPSLVAQPTGVGLLSQPTGFAGRIPAPLAPQITGFVDPRLQMMSSSFMPANISAPYTSAGAPQLAPPPQQQLGGLSLQQSFQQHNQVHGRGNAPKIPWALSKAEKKQYDQIFRAWDAQGTGFISGQAALEVFGQSGLDRNDLARIWTLADADNRGKLNLAEFHVAMGFIYRRLNGNDIPDELPAELVPPSSRDLDTSVNFLKDILKNDTRARSPSGIDAPVSALKNRSLHSSSSFTQRGGRQDATVYKHEDVEPPGGFYQPRNRHVDRSAIRSRADDASPATADLSSIKRQLLNTQKMLDDTLANEESSDVLDRELEDLRYRITRLQEDLEYLSKGPRSTAKDEERRRLERELVRLMHEEVPELEKKVEEREARREREKREWARDRDRRNERLGRYGGDDSGRYSPASRYREEEDRPYSRGASRYDQDDRDRHSDIRDRGSPPVAHTRTPPAAPPAPPTNTIAPPPAPPAPSRSPAPATKNMTPEERQAYIRAEAQRRLEARKQALGVVAPSAAATTSPTLDTTIETRLAEEKREAEERAREAERQAEERQKQRREKLEVEKALKEGRTVTPTPTTTAPPPAPAPVPTPASTPSKIAPPPPKPRAPAPPPPRKGSTPRAPPTPAPAQAPAPAVPPVPAAPTPAVRTVVPPPPAEPGEDPEDAALKARQEALRKKAEERAALMRKLEEEEEEARKAEAAYKERRNQFLAAKNAASASTPTSPPPAPPAPPVSVPVQAEEPAPEEAAPPPPPPPPPPAPPAAAPAGDKPSNNPFSRMMKDGGGAAPPASTTGAANGSSNPFFRAQKDSDDEWDDVMEKDDGDSSDEELATRDARRGLAQQLFGTLLPSRPQSAGPAPTAGSPVSPVAPPPPPPSAPPAPAAPAAPSAPIVAPAPTGDRSALLSAIQGGARLRKAATNDRSGAATLGRVVGDNAPPAHVNAVARPSSPPTEHVSVPAAAFTLPAPSVEPPMGQNASSSLGHMHRESVDWYNGLAADVERKDIEHLPATVEEDEEQLGSSVPAIHVSDHAPEGGSELMADVDHATEFRVRSLYSYEGQRAEDLSFDANTIIVAHPSKSGGDWWHGILVKDGKTGFFPQTYIQKVEQVHATALYTYEGTNSDYLSFAEGDILTLIDRSETDWWKAERDGVVYNVPAAYLEVTEDDPLGRDLQRQGQMTLEQGLGQNGDVLRDQFITPYTSPQDVRDPGLGTSPSLNRKQDKEDDGDDDDDDAYYSFDEEDNSDSEGETDAEREARELESRRILENTGLVVNTAAFLDDEAPLADGQVADVSHPVPSSIGAISESPRRQRRAAPAPPLRTSLSHLKAKDLPPIPKIDLPHDTDSDTTSALPSTDAETNDNDNKNDRRRGHMKAASETSFNSAHPNDAFERYESFKKTQVHPEAMTLHRLNCRDCQLRAPAHSHGSSPARMSVSSFDTASFGLPSPPRSPATSVTPSLRDREGGGESRTSQFLSFLGRHTRSATPDIEKERKIVISGPMLHAPVSSNAGVSPGGVSPGGGEAGPSREDSPAFGSSWASLVDRSALEEIPKDERKRQEAIFELISTETDYVRDLQLIVQLFYSRLVQILDEEATKTIFSNIEDILLTNTTFLSTLEERQRDCRLYIDRIGDLLEKHIPNMRTYLNYCVNQANAGKVLQQMRETNPDLATHLQELREVPSARNLDLSSYLLVPMQRLTRYPLLIRQIMHYTDPSPPGVALESSAFWGDIAERQSISAALQAAETILEEVNETIREQEGCERLREISRELWIGQGRLDLTAPTRQLGPRKLLKEGVLSKAKSGRKLRVLLCSDILVLVDEVERGLYRVPIPVNEIQLMQSRSGRDDPLIRIHVAYPRGGDTIVLKASTVREAKVWKDAIGDAGREAREVRDTRMY